MNESQTGMDLNELLNQVTYADLIVCAAGLFVLIYWLWTTSFGTKSLEDSPHRRNNMPFYIGLIPVLIWILTIAIMAEAQNMTFPDLEGWKKAFSDNLMLSLGGIPAIAAVFFIGKMHFARGLKGFGLNPIFNIRLGS